MRETIFAVVFVFCCAFRIGANGYKILGVFPSSSRSHYIVGAALMKGLAAKGHEVSVITAFPCNERIKNFEELPVPEILNRFEDFNADLQRMGDQFIFWNYVQMILAGRILSETILEQPIVQELLSNPNRTFDLVICEIFITDALFGFAQHFNASAIGISPMGNNMWTSALSGSPTPASFMPNIFLGYTDRMSFPQRVLNLAALTIQQVGYHLIWTPYQAKVYNKFFPNARLTLQDALKNISLILLNQHVSIAYPEPLLQNMIEVGGLNIKRELKPLPAEIKNFLDDATHGAIYFSLGTNWKSKSLRKDKLKAILNTFKSLKQRVLWKYENSSLPEKSDNILISDWFPQNEILAHHNVKLFIGHGGMLGTTEAVYHGKPLLAIPLFCDQYFNTARATSGGYALEVSYSELDKDKFKATIEELLTNPKYKEAAKLVSERYRDQPMEPLDTAIYWVEYALRHKGAPHLRSAALDLNFIQYNSLDAGLVYHGGTLLIAYLLGRLLKRYISGILRLHKKSTLKKE